MKNKKGFTLLELLICVALISVVIIFLFRLISLIRQDEKAVGYIRANQASRNQVVGEIGSIIAENAVCSYSTTGSNSSKALITLNLCTDRTLIVEVKRDYIKYSLDGIVTKYPMKDKKAWYNPVFTLVEGNYYGYDYHKIVFKSEKKGMDSSPIDDVEIFWVDKNGFADDDIVHAQLLPGSEFSIKVRRIANKYLVCTDAEMAEYATRYDCMDTNIKRIARANSMAANLSEDNVVSTSNSDTPIVAWYSDGTLYLYSQAPIFTLNPNSSFMFAGLMGLESIDLSLFDSSQVTNIAAFFQNDVSLQYADLSSLNTHNVRNMSYMFNMPGAQAVGAYEAKLRAIVFGPGFDTSNVTTMRYMFANNVSLVRLDLSGFDTRNVNDFTGLCSYCTGLTYINLGSMDLSKATDNEKLSMLYNDEALQTLITPKMMPTSTSYYFNLPVSMRNESIGRTFTKIDSSTPSSIELTRVS